MAKQSDKMYVNKIQLAEILNVSGRWISELQADKGLPQVQRGKYYLPDVIAWWTEYQTELIKREHDSNHGEYSLHKARLMKTQADRNQLKLEKERGEVISTDAIIAAVAQRFVTIRTRFLGLPNKIAPVIMKFQNQNEVKAFIDERIREILTELSEIDYSKLDEQYDS